MTISIVSIYHFVVLIISQHKKGEEMEEVKLNVRALAAMMNKNIRELAEASGIEYTHLRLVSCGRATMTGEDLLALAETCNVPPSNINASKKQ